MAKTSALSRSEWWLVGGIILVAFVLRLYRITNPIADWHAFRQADTASVTREYVKHGIDLLRPHYQDLSNIQSGQDNLAGYRMVEFPLVNGLIAQVLRWFPSFSLVVVSRLASVLASLVSLWLLFGLVYQYGGKDRALVAAFIWATLPFSVFYSRVVLPEPFMVMTSLGAIWAFDRWLVTKHWRWWGVSWLSLAVALLLKPFVVFLAPVWLAICWRRQGWRPAQLLGILVYGATVTWPFWAWREWIKQFPTGIPASDWLFNSNGIRLRPAWWRWLGYERLVKLMLGYIGSWWLVAAGLRLAHQWKTEMLYVAWGMGLLVYMIVVATGNVQHDYYQVLAIPFVCAVLAIGVESTFRWLETHANCRVAQVVVGGLLLATGWLSWQQVKGYYQVNHWEYIRAGQVVDQLVPAEARVIAPAFGDTQFLFQTNRTGWPIGFEIEQKRALGATHYITTSDDDEARQLEALYPTIAKGNGYLLLDLRQPRQSSATGQATTTQGKTP